MSSSSALPLSTYRAHAQSLNDALSKKKKELVAARLARTRAVGAGPPGPRSPCPAARSVGMRSRHVQVCFGGCHFEELIVVLVVVVDVIVLVAVAVARCCRICFSSRKFQQHSRGNIVWACKAPGRCTFDGTHGSGVLCLREFSSTLLHTRGFIADEEMKRPSAY